MLRITNTVRPDGVTLVLEGRLAGVWVDEVARCWKALAAARDARSISIQLDGVTFIDAAGKALLRTVHQEGAALAGSGCMTRAILDEISGPNGG
jgi:ABC-type transporter Mla MlaB component